MVTNKRGVDQRVWNMAESWMDAADDLPDYEPAPCWNTALEVWAEACQAAIEDAWETTRPEILELLKGETA